MALIGMAVYDTEANGRTKFTERTLQCLQDTVDLTKHNLIVIDNNSCQETKKLLKDYNTITLPENIGTAKAINLAWRLREPKQHLIKMDNDVVIHSTGWVEELEETIETDIHIGILGLKRKDLIEDPYRNDFYKSELRMLKHRAGDKWRIVEDVTHVMGTCQMYNYRLIDKIGGLYQMGSLYGFDDSLASLRSQLAGFRNSFLSHINIDHIDNGGTDYQKWKESTAMDFMKMFNETKEGMNSGAIPIYYEL